MNTVNSVALLKEVRIEQRSESWMSGDILNNFRERDSLLPKFNKNNHMTEYCDEYRKMHNKVQREIKQANQHYLVNKIDDNKHDSKSSGKVLKSLDTKTSVKIPPILFWTLMAKNFMRVKQLPINLTNSLLVLLQNLLMSCLSLVDFMMLTQKGLKATILCFTKSVKTLFMMSWITSTSTRALTWMT